MDDGYNLSDLSDFKRLLEDLNIALSSYDCTVRDNYMVINKNSRMVLIRSGFTTIDMFYYVAGNRIDVVSIAQTAPNIMGLIFKRTCDWLV